MRVKPFEKKRKLFILFVINEKKSGQIFGHVAHSNFFAEPQCPCRIFLS